MEIQWFPGHMAKTKREVIEKLKQIDIVFELVDARIPQSSQNPMIDQIIGDKPRILLLNKADLADPSVTKEWLSFFQKKDIEVLTINAQTGEGTEQLLSVSKQLMHKKNERMRSKGVKPRTTRTVILGIPNVGKSTLINHFAGKKIAKIGDRPGITKQQSWIKVKGKLELLDTSGILWPKFKSRAVGLRLAATGAVRDEVLELQEIAMFVLRFLKRNYPDRLMNRYKFESADDGEDELFAAIAKRRGCLNKGGRIDEGKTSELIVHDFRTGKFGRITLEVPPI